MRGDEVGERWWWWDLIEGCEGCVVGRKFDDGRGVGG